MPTIAEQLLERVRPSWPQHVRSISENVLGTIATAQANWQSVKDKGDVATIRGLHSGNVAPKIGTAMRALTRAKSDLEKARASLRERSLAHDTPRDAQMAAEIRAAIKAMPQSARIPLLMGETANKLAQRAVLEAPELLTGVVGPFRADVEKDFLRQNFTADLHNINMTAEALDHASTCVEGAKLEAGKTCKFSGPLEASEWWSKATSPAGAAEAEHRTALREKADAERAAFIAARSAELAGIAAAS